MPASPPDDGLEKSANLLIALGEDLAAEVLKHLGPREVQKIGHAMAGLKSVPRATVESVLDSFLKDADEHSAVHVDTDSYVRSVLTKALGDDKASNLISRILQGGETSGIEGLKWMDAPTKHPPTPGAVATKSLILPRRSQLQGLLVLRTRQSH